MKVKKIITNNVYQLPLYRVFIICARSAVIEHKSQSCEEFGTPCSKKIIRPSKDHQPENQNIRKTLKDMGEGTGCSRCLEMLSFFARLEGDRGVTEGYHRNVKNH